MRTTHTALIGTTLVILSGIVAARSVMVRSVTVFKVDTTYAVRHDTVWTGVVTDSAIGVPAGAVVCKTPLGMRVFPAPAFLGYDRHGNVWDKEHGDKRLLRINAGVYCEQR